MLLLLLRPPLLLLHGSRRQHKGPRRWVSFSFTELDYNVLLRCDAFVRRRWAFCSWRLWLAWRGGEANVAAKWTAETQQQAPAEGGEVRLITAHLVVSLSGSHLDNHRRHLFSTSFRTPSAGSMDKLTIISGCLFLAADIFAIASIANPDWINTGESAGKWNRPFKAPLHSAFKLDYSPYSRIQIISPSYNILLCVDALISSRPFVLQLCFCSLLLIDLN